jgi:Uma2 family endonuclease
LCYDVCIKTVQRTAEVDTIEAGPLDMSVTEPREVKLTIADLELLDREWRKTDAFRSTELIDGRIYHTAARYIPRATATGELMFRLRDALEAIGSGHYVGIRGSIAMPPHDLPLPDIVLTDAPSGPWFIPAASVPLVIEVAETALDFFMGEKARLYARNGIPEYWVLDLQGRAIHQRWSPQRDGYAKRREVSLGDPIEAITLAGISISTAGLA